jgi:hypothetical protein
MLSRRNMRITLNLSENDILQILMEFGQSECHSLFDDSVNTQLS